jgi:hypothetical protein
MFLTRTCVIDYNRSYKSSTRECYSNIGLDWSVERIYNIALSDNSEHGVPLVRISWPFAFYLLAIISAFSTFALSLKLNRRLQISLRFSACVSGPRKIIQTSNLISDTEDLPDSEFITIKLHSAYRESKILVGLSLFSFASTLTATAIMQKMTNALVAAVDRRMQDEYGREIIIDERGSLAKLPFWGISWAASVALGLNVLFLYAVMRIFRNTTVKRRAISECGDFELQ